MDKIVFPNTPRIVVVISTTGRSSLINVALPSVFKQIRLPDFLYVVADFSVYLPEQRISELNIANIPVKLLVNTRERNLSGAMNSVFSEMLMDGLDPENTFMAVLDDDDWWEPEYLDSCYTTALQTKSDWVVSGIIRHENASAQGKYLSIPDTLTYKSFLRGNPHIQGSNLFIRFSKLLLAGGYDENLPSTTDRDLCLRLLALGNVRVISINRHMVHYLTCSKGRLSESGTEKKCTGLEKFYYKYRPLMDMEDRNQFLERAEKYFNCKPLAKAEAKVKNNKPELLLNPAEGEIHIVIGVIISQLEYLDALVSDMVRLKKNGVSISSLVISDNAGLDSNIIQEDKKELARNGIQLYVISADEANISAGRGDLGSYYCNEKNRKGIAFGRTVLHRYTYLECLKYSDPVAWIIDDDVSIHNFYWGTLDNEIPENAIMGQIGQWKKNGISIVVGKVGGDPPIPIMSTVRTQLLDFYFYLNSYIKGNSMSNREMKFMEYNDISKTIPAYFYDFPDTFFGHLETPAWKYPGYTSSDQLYRNAKMILRKAVSRPAYYPVNGNETGETYYSPNGKDFGPVRGGNTIILDIDCMRDFTNSSPRSGNVPYRRGDTLWVVLNKRLGPRRPLQKARIVISSPFMLVQDRRNDESSEQMREKLVSDALGSAFVRSMDAFLQECNRKIPQRQDYYQFLEFSGPDIEKIISTMQLHIDKRVRQILLNLWRIKGLIISIRSLIKQMGCALSNDPFQTDKIYIINDMCTRIEKLFSETEMDKIIYQIKNFSREDVTDYLQSLSSSCRLFSDSLPIRYSEKNNIQVKSTIIETFNSGNLQHIGTGKEGIVFSDGQFVYKYFHYGKFAMDNRELKFLSSNLSGKRFKGIANLCNVSTAGGFLIFKGEYVNGKPYHGGKVRQLASLLRECKSNGIVIKNIAPKNLVDTGREVKFVDLGRDLESYTPDGFKKMCMRAYLSFRWYFRPDIHELLHRTNLSSDMPELFGFQYFLDLMQEVQTGDMSVPFALGEMSNIKNMNIIDYGCGNGQMADQLADNNHVSVYDIDMSRFYKKHHGSGRLKILNREELNRISGQQDRFDEILMSLVLCTVDNREVREILADARTLVNDSGEISVVICNPFNVNNIETANHVKRGYIGGYHDLFEYEKIMKITGNTRHEYHRPLDWYIRELKRAGFMPYKFSESSGASFDFLSPGSEYLMIHAHSVSNPETRAVSLMITASPMEWRTIGFQIRHIVGQLEGPEKFIEKYVTTDHATKDFARQYDTANLEAFDLELEKLRSDGVIDFVIHAPENPVSKETIAEQWFGQKCTESRCANGQPVLTILDGFNHANSRYLLQMNSDVIISRDGTDKSFLKEMINVLHDNKNAVTVSFPIPNREKNIFTSGNGSAKWRTEVRNCMLDMERFISLCPLPNSLNNNSILEYPWHRALDLKLKMDPGDSYRGSTGNACFVHVPNSKKKDINFWYNAVKYHENHSPRNEQIGFVDLNAMQIQDVVETRDEEMIVIVKGRDIPIPKIRRCLKSILEQDFQEFSVLYIDAASNNGSDDYMQYIGKELFPGRITLFRNYFPLTSMENLFIGIRKICTNPQSIIVLLDADDALARKDTLSLVRSRYDNGSDLTVGTMLRTDKYKEYPVNFHNPRLNRGGNVWQHLRTFRKYLFDSIPEDYFKINGEWITEADDWAYMIPMVEIAENAEVIHEPVYFYEPSPEKKKRDKERYGDTIAKIVAKKSYQKEVTK